MSYDLSDYVDVAERVRVFADKFPEGSLQTEIVEFTETRVTVKAFAYRTADDPRPGTGHSSLTIPGSTPYTRGSELENAETSAIGRAIVALGFPTKKIASADEVRNKQAGEPAATGSANGGDERSGVKGLPPESPAVKAQQAQRSNPVVGDIEVTFGKYKGQMLSVVPDGYKRWLAGDEFEPKTPDQHAVKEAAQVALGLVTVGGGGVFAPYDSDIPFAWTWA